MTDDQFQTIQQYVTERLQSEAEFSMIPDEFCKGFDLSRPYYAEFIVRMKKLGSLASFQCDAPWKDAIGDPSDPIRFWRP